MLPPQTGFLEATLKHLHATFHTPFAKRGADDDDDDDDDDVDDDDGVSSSSRKPKVFPVLPWRDMASWVRKEVNPLASEEHLRELIQQLQLQGDVSRCFCCC